VLCGIEELITKQGDGVKTLPPMNYDAAKVDCGRPLSFEKDAKVEQTHDACKVILHSYNRLIEKKKQGHKYSTGYGMT
jgi:hypothetical protein